MRNNAPINQIYRNLLMDIILSIAKISVPLLRNGEVSRPDWQTWKVDTWEVGGPGHREPPGNRTTDLRVARRMRYLPGNPPYIPPIDI
ncbi:Uncharacterized protein APZ42_019890 [Daphnia magna]|uniref:Uncharacterized protein n=1 Tax=Daphnia magna TaxID=35525 RepID=A0A164XTE9_9CRUS|nr:Uncharacterized protein APZ42_019890 [Daphnia magna]